MKKLLLGLLAAIALLGAPAALADGAPSTVGYMTTSCGTAPSPCFVQYGSTLPVSGSFSATLSGFTPNGNYASPLSVTTSTGNIALPAGTSVLVQNVGANVAYVNLGTSNAVTATTSAIAVPAGGGCSLTVGSNTYLAAITASSTTTLNLAGGTGLGNACYGGGSSGGGSSNITQWNSNTVSLNNGTTDAGTLRVTLSSDSTGVVAATQSGTWNITNVSGTISLPTGAATSALQTTGNTALTTINTTLGTPMQNSGGSVTANIGTIGTAASAANQTAVQGSVAGGSAPSQTNVSGALYNSTQPSLTNGQSVALQVDAKGNARGVIMDAAGNGRGANVTAGNAILVDASATTQPVSGTVTANAGTGQFNVTCTAANCPMNVAQINGVTPLMGNGVTGTGSQRVTIASDNTAFAVNATLQTGANTVGKVDILGNAGATLDAAASQNVAAPTNGLLVLGQFSTTPTTLTNLNVSPLQMDNAGRLIVNCTSGCGGSGGTSIADEATFTQGTTSITPIGGIYTTSVTNLTTGQAGIVQLTNDRKMKTAVFGNTGAAMDAAGQNASSPANELLIAGQFNTTPTTITSGNVSPFQMDNAGNLLVNVKAGGGSGGTSSTFGAAFPATGTAIGASNGGNMVYLAADGSHNLDVNCITGCSSTSDIVASGSLTSTASVTSGTLNGVATAKVQITGTWVGTVQFEGSVDGTNYFALNALPVGGGTTVTSATANGQWDVNVAGLQLMRVRASAFTSGTIVVTARNSTGAGAVFEINSLPTGTNSIGQVTANAGTNLNTSLLALESGGNLATVATNSTTIAGAVTSSIMQDNVAKINNVTPLMGNGATGTGSLRVTVASDNTAFSVNAAESGTWNITNISGTVSLPTGAATSANQSSVIGTKAAGTAATNSLLTGGVYNSSAPTLTTGQQVATQMDSSGNTLVNVAVALPTGANTIGAVTQASGPWTSNVTQFGGVNVSTGTGAGGTGIPRVTISNDSSLAANQSVNVAQINGVTPLMGNGATGTGSQRVTIASDNTAFSVNAVQSGNWTARVVGNGGATLDAAANAAAPTNQLNVGGVYNSTPGSVTNTNANPLQIDAKGNLRITNMDAAGNARGANVDAGNSLQIAGEGTAGSAAGGVVTIQGAASMTKLLVTPDALPANQSVNVNQIGGNAVLTGNGTTGTGSQRVTIASDNTAFTVNAAESGTWTVQPGNTANTTAWIMQPVPGTTGGLTLATVTAANSTNATNLKASAGTLYHITGYNNSATLAWVSFYNTAGTPTCGTSIVYQMMIPANSTSGAGAIDDIPMGLNFGTGIGYCITTGIAGTGSVAASAYVVNFGYK